MGLLTSASGDRGAPTDDARAKVEAVVAAVRLRLLAELPARLDRCAGLAQAAMAGDGAAGAALRIELHSLAGAAATVGLRALGSQARALEAEAVAASETGLWPDAFLDRLGALSGLIGESPDC